MKLGVLTGGGDCPGLNAAIRAVVLKAASYGYETVGILDGWAGLVKPNTRPLSPQDVAAILPLGGTILGSSRTNPGKTPEGLAQVKDNLAQLGIDALVAIGGDDTLGVAAKLFKIGVKTVGVPKTMDNDINGADFCIGFDSAVSIVTDSLDKLSTTAASHHRVLVVEVMGRDAGWVATIGGIAGGADYIFIPEIEGDVEDACTHLQKKRADGKGYNIVVVAEGAKIKGLEQDDGGQSKTDAFGHVRLEKRGVGEALAEAIERHTGYETRVAVLGHLQRGGSPTTNDRLLGTRTGVAAVELVKNGNFGKMPVLQGNKIVIINLADAVAKNQGVDLELYKLAQNFF